METVQHLAILTIHTDFKFVYGENTHKVRYQYLYWQPDGL